MLKKPGQKVVLIYGRISWNWAGDCRAGMAKTMPTLFCLPATLSVSI